MIAQLLANLTQTGAAALMGREVAEALYLAQYLPARPLAAAAEVELRDETATLPPDTGNAPATAAAVKRRPDTGDLFLPQAGTIGAGAGATAFGAATATALPGAAGMARALRPLLRRVPSRTRREPDIERTVQLIADGGSAAAVLRPAPERWLEIALVADTGASMRVWRPTLREWQRLLERHGAFRAVRAWSLNADDGAARFYRGSNRPAEPRELIDPAGRRLILVLSDCVATGWHNGAAFRLLAEWGAAGPVALVQVLPPRLWPGTGLPALEVELHAGTPGAANRKLTVTGAAAIGGLPLPVVTLADWSLTPWARLVAGRGTATATGLLIPDQPQPHAAPPPDDEPTDAHARTARFRAAASRPAYRLACCLAAVEVNLPVMRLVQQAMLPEAHLAEVFLGGLLRPLPAAPDSTSDEPEYDFHPGVRELLLADTPTSVTWRVVTEVSRLIEGRLPYAAEFRALLAQPEATGERRIATGGRSFGRISPTALQRLGFLITPPETIDASELDVQPAPAAQATEPPPPIVKSTFEFETVTLNARGKETLRRRLTARQFIEELVPDVPLAMVEIPGGSFLMGAPQTEERNYDYGPQHEVTVAPFFMGKFAVTQAQWRAVADTTLFPKVKIDLNPDPARFKGDDRPVERVNWLEAQEFCARLAARTDRAYRLPTEAEWEYACRAGTTTPFAFGETITPEIVNYDGGFPYAKAKKGKCRSETVPVGSLGVANVFGLYDMHGNVWEWCEDDWHADYNGAPSDGRAWADISSRGSYRVDRGGGWIFSAVSCRSALRIRDAPGDRAGYLGFRLVRT